MPVTYTKQKGKLEMKNECFRSYENKKTCSYERWKKNILMKVLHTVLALTERRSQPIYKKKKHIGESGNARGTLTDPKQEVDNRMGIIIMFHGIFTHEASGKQQGARHGTVSSDAMFHFSLNIRRFV